MFFIYVYLENKEIKIMHFTLITTWFRNIMKPSNLESAFPSFALTILDCLCLRRVG